MGKRLALWCLLVGPLVCCAAPVPLPPTQAPQPADAPVSAQQVTETTLAPKCIDCDALKQATYDQFARRRAEAAKGVIDDRPGAAGP